MRVSSFRPSRALAFAVGFLFSGLAVAASTKPGDPAQGLATYFDNGVYNLLSNVLGTAPGGEGYADYVRTEFFSVPRAETGDALTTRDRPVPITLHVEHYAPETDTRTYTYTVVSGPSHGSLSGAPPDLVYTPDKGFTGFDRLMFQVSDGSQVSEATPVRIKVTGSTTLFESGPVRPLALSSDGTRLYAVNTPDARLEIFDVSGATPKPIGSVPVGMEPVAVSLRNDDEAWVVNTLSDSVSIVDLSAPQPYVKRTLPVGDEPQDVVFAGPNRSRAFITTAHRGQNSPSDPQLFTPGVGRADVWVYDADAIDSAATAATPPLTILTLFGTPARALAVSPDGSAVYAAIYKSGNQTTVVGENNKGAGRHSTKNGQGGPHTDATGKRGGNTAVIVQYDGQHWRDSYGHSWDRFVRFSLPDKDVFVIDANASTPQVKGDYAHVGTTLFNMAVNPKSGALYVSNLEARNLNRFEGDGNRSDQITLDGRFIYNRITVIKNGQVLPRNLDKHLSDASPIGSPDDSARSLALPLQMAVDGSGSTLYVAAFGSAEVGVFNVGQLEDDSFVPSADSHIAVTGGGPAGMVLDDSQHRLFVSTRFDDGISVIDTGQKAEVAHVTMYSPEPDFVVNGRHFLYDARFTSSKGDAACGSCHLFGDMDGLAWNLGNPDLSWKVNPRRYVNPATFLFALRAFHPLKGPMTTQSLRGLEFQGPEHWRGDRTGTPRINGETLEKAAFKQFDDAYLTLMGNTRKPTDAEISAFADFAMQLRYPPNPIRHLDNSLSKAEADGEDVYFNVLTTGIPGNGTPGTGEQNAAMVTCNDCHTLDPLRQRFGSSTLMAFEGFDVSQNFKVPQLRNIYQKFGMFGQANRILSTPFMGPQVQGFGFVNEGSVDTLQHFFQSSIFHVPPRRLNNVIRFVAALDTGMEPIVGQQFTLTQATADGQSRIDLMKSRALAHTQPGGPAVQECELIAKGVVGGRQRSWLMLDSGRFRSDDPAEGTISDAALRNLALTAGNALTYTCVPPGDGTRMGIDRDEDGILDAVDTVTEGVAPTSIAPVDPNAPEEIDQPQDAGQGGFVLEEIEKAQGTWPVFTLF